jgi:proline dehydrogenase
VGFSTQVLRPAILGVAHHPWVEGLVTRSRVGRAVNTRFVAGETLPEALAAARSLAQDGIGSMISLLGEHVGTPQEALGVREAYLAEIAAAAQDPDLDLVASVKPTHLGLDDSVETCWSMLEPILAEGERTGTWVMLDMEDAPYVDRTLELTRRAHERWPRSGVAIQSYLRRSADDVFALPEGCRVRLVKGAYLEPADIVFRSMRDVNASYRDLFATLFARGHVIDVATHDPVMIEGVRSRMDAVPGAWSRVEFQMLYGVRRDLQVSLARQGYPVRVSIPYGTEWYPYLTRRLAERPANLWFFLSNLVRMR